MRATIVHCDRCKQQIPESGGIYQISAGNEEFADLKAYDICVACLRAFGEFIGATTHVPFGEVGYTGAGVRP